MEQCRVPVTIDEPHGGTDIGPFTSGVVVDVRSVSYGYGSRAVLRGLSLTLERGEAVALVGRSGAGKSTLLKLVNGLLLPDEGTVLVEGVATWSWDRIRLRRRTGYVLQGIGLFPHLTVEQNVALVPTLEGWDASQRRARAGELLDLVGLPASEYAERWPEELSGGQQQRVGVARALAARPPVLLMDEPFGALDPATRRELQRVFLRVQRDLAQTVLLVTHDIAEAFALGTRVGVIDEGSLVAVDAPDAIARSTDARVRRLIDSSADDLEGRT